jgi:hypothetical protein
MFATISKPSLDLSQDLIEILSDELGIEKDEIPDILGSGHLTEIPELDYEIIVNSMAFRVKDIADKDSQRYEIEKICHEMSYNLKRAENQFYVGRVQAPILFQLKSGEYYLVSGDAELILMFHYDIDPMFFLVQV